MTLSACVHCGRPNPYPCCIDCIADGKPTMSESGLTFTITMSEEQARVLSLACETLARLGMGQVDYALEYAPGDLDWDQRIAIKHLLAAPMGFDHPNTSLGIRAASLPARRAWDLHAVVRQQIAMNNDFPEHDTWRREPDQIAGEPLPKCSVG